MRLTNSRFWAAASALFGCIAVCKGLRVPGSWALSQLQITYIHGFVKRGLIGQLLALAHVRSLAAVQAFCWAEEVFLIALLVLFVGKSRLLSHQGAPAVVAAFAGSYTITFLAHLIGYQDIALYGLGIVVLLIREAKRRFMVALPVCAIALLAHEIALLSIVPVILFSFAVENDRIGSKAYRYAGILLVAALFLAGGVALQSSLDAQTLATFERETIARSAYPIDARSFSVLGMSLLANLKLNYQVITANWWWWAEMGVALMVLGPLLALLLWTAHGWARGKQWILFLCASLAPLLLNVVAWDNVRWACLCSLNTFLNLGLLARSTVPRNRQSSRLQERFAIVVLGIGMASGYGLMDSAKVRPYPFFPSVIRPAVIRHDGVPGQVL